MNIDLFIKQRGLSPQDKLSNDTDSYWKLKDLLEDFVECQNEEQSLPVDGVNDCKHEHIIGGDGCFECADCGVKDH